MLKETLTTEQKKRLAELATEDPDFCDALATFGDDVYKDGMIKGGLVVAASMVLGGVISAAVQIIVAKFTNRNRSKKEEP